MNKYQSLRKGAMYLVQYLPEGKRSLRQAAMRYMDQNDESLFFDARPVAGTQELPKTWIRLIEERAPSIEPYVSKIVR